jgi:hypothetical protein
MTEIRSILLHGSSSESNMESTAKKRLGRLAAYFVTALAFSSFAFWWPTFARLALFAFLCCFPVIFPFCFFVLLSDPNRIKQRWKHKVLATVIVVHCALLTWMVYAWTALSRKASIDNPDVVFGFVVVEAALTTSLARLVGRKPNET